jgi:hypothetical protein
VKGEREEAEHTRSAVDAPKGSNAVVKNSLNMPLSSRWAARCRRAARRPTNASTFLLHSVVHVDSVRRAYSASSNAPVAGGTDTGAGDGAGAGVGAGAGTVTFWKIVMTRSTTVGSHG